MATRQKSVTVDGKRYTVTDRTFDPGIVDIKGHGVWTARAIGIDDPELRERVADAVRQQRENNRRASEGVQEAVRNGTAGLGK